MKTTILFTLIVFAQLALNAQWTNDPDNPMVVQRIQPTGRGEGSLPDLASCPCAL